MIAHLVAARWRYAGGRWSLAGVALSCAVALLVVASGASLVTEDSALRRGIAELGIAERILTVATYREPAEVLPPDLDEVARAGLSRLGSDDPVRVMLFRELADETGDPFQLSAADELARWVDVVDGRLPQRCDPSYCEVVQLAERRPVGPIDASLGVVVVGTVARRHPMLLAGTYEPRPDTAIVLADGVERLDRLSALEYFGRSFGWIAEVDLTALRSAGTDRWAGDSVAVANELLAEPYNLGLTAPDDVVVQEVARARRSAQRFRLLGGTMGVLLLGGALVGAVAMRRDQEAFRGALRRRGLAARRLAALTVAEVTILVVLAAAAGLTVGGAVTGLLTARSELAIWPTVRSAITEPLPWVIALSLAAIGLCVAVLVRSAGAPGSATGWRAVEGGAVATAGVSALIVMGDPARPGARWDSSMLPLLPVMVLLTVGLVAARAVPVLADALRRLTPRPKVVARLGLAGVGGRPLRPAATAAVVAVAMGAVVFALSYRQTLIRGAADQAANQVPFEALVTTGPTLERALDLIDADFARDVGGVVAPVLRLAASARVSADTGELVQMLGIDPPVMRHVRRWDATVGSSSGDAIGAAIDTATVASGVAVPAGRRIEIDATGPAIDVAVTLTMRDGLGRVRSVALRVEPEGGRDMADGPQRLEGELPDFSGEQYRLVAMVVSEPSDVTTRRQHNLGEGRFDRESAAGVMHLGTLTVDGRLSTAPWSDVSGMQIDEATGVARLSYVMAASRVNLPVGDPGPGAVADAPLPMVVDPFTAATAGGVGARLTLSLNQVAIHGIVSAIVPRFPTLTGRFAVVDRAALQGLADRTAPGTGQPGELWIATDGDRQGLDSPVLRRLRVESRDQIETELRTDPVALSAIRLLLAAAAATSALALVVVVSLVVSQRHDDAPESLALEADGLGPGELRRVLWWGVVAVVAPAAPIGLFGGWLLSRLTARLIPATATAQVPRPPLVAGTGAGLAGLAAVAVVVVSLVVAAAVATRFHRESMPPRASGSVA